MYMGDRPMKVPNSEAKIAHSIVASCIACPELRDELYCQVCKQTCYNPQRSSSFRGWELFVVAVLNFPPTRNLESSLRCYWEEHIKVGRHSNALLLTD
jgi:Rho GTPase-activating protein 39